MGLSRQFRNFGEIGEKSLEIVFVIGILLGVFFNTIFGENGERK